VAPSVVPGYKKDRTCHSGVITLANCASSLSHEIAIIAALKPPSLKAIAPWEPCGDLYQEQFVRGGIFNSGLFDFIIKHNIQGHSGVENFQEMYRRYQKGDSAYWKDKRADIEKIGIPTYITASYTNFVHTMGSTAWY
jgi:predicted acyl esterase